MPRATRFPATRSARLPAPFCRALSRASRLVLLLAAAGCGTGPDVSKRIAPAEACRVDYGRPTDGVHLILVNRSYADRQQVAARLRPSQVGDDTMAALVTALEEVGYFRLARPLGAAGVSPSSFIALRLDEGAYLLAKHGPSPDHAIAWNRCLSLFQQAYNLGDTLHADGGTDAAGFDPAREQRRIQELNERRRKKLEIRRGRRQ